MSCLISRLAGCSQSAFCRDSRTHHPARQLCVRNLLPGPINSWVQRRRVKAEAQSTGGEWEGRVQLPFVITEIFIDLLMCASMVGGPSRRSGEREIWIKMSPGRGDMAVCGGGEVG